MHSYFKREILIGFAIIFGSILVFAAIIFFVSQDVAVQAEKVVIARTLIAERGATLSALAGLKKDAPAAARYKTALNAILATQDQLFDFQRWLEGLARGRSLSMSFSFQGSPALPSAEAPGYTPFTIRTGGGFASVLGFLKDIELASPRFLLVLDTFTLRSGGGNYDFSANGRVFFR